MKKIDIQKWKIFHLYDEHMFYIDMGNKFDKSKMDTTKNDINFVGRTGTNNGINATCGKYNNIEPYEAGLLTLALGGSVGSCFIQQKPFYTSQNVIVLIPKDSISDYAKHFVARVIQKESELHYQAFVKELNAHIKTDFVIPLPVNKHNEPDWEYMESYMKNIIQESEENIGNLSKLKAIQTKIDIKNWKNFYIGGKAGLFNTYTGGDLILYKTKSGEIPIISHSSENNGIQMKSEIIEGRKLFDCKRTISLADRGNFKAFIQDENFYIGTRVKALELKKQIKTPSKYSMQFIATVIDRLAVKFSYKDNATSSLDSQQIPLPINKEGEPDWEYMENYMKNIIEDTQLKLDKLICC